MAKKKHDDLDTETTIVDMNVDGFRWYNPAKKKAVSENKPQQDIRLTKKEKRAMYKGAFLAVLPFVLCIVLVFGVLFLLAYLWLQ